MINHFWGWGQEDDELKSQLHRFYKHKTKHFNVSFDIFRYGFHFTRPVGLSTGVKNTFKHIHNKSSRRRDKQMCKGQVHNPYKRTKTGGLQGTKFKIVREKDFTFEGSNVTVVYVELNCDEKKTPWCKNCSYEHIALFS